MSDQPTMTPEQALANYEEKKRHLAEAQAELDKLKVGMMSDLVKAAIHRFALDASSSPKGTAIITMPIIGVERPVYLVEADEFTPEQALVFLEKPFKSPEWTTHKIYDRLAKGTVKTRRYGYWRYGAQFVIEKGVLKSKKYADFIDLTKANPPADPEPLAKTAIAGTVDADVQWSIKTIADHAMNSLEALKLSMNITDDPTGDLIDELCAELQNRKP